MRRHPFMSGVIMSETFYSSDNILFLLEYSEFKRSFFSLTLIFWLTNAITPNVISTLKWTSKLCCHREICDKSFESRSNYNIYFDDKPVHDKFKVVWSNVLRFFFQHKWAEKDQSQITFTLLNRAPVIEYPKSTYFH